ncbi:hypothetical protein [Aeromicrobium duanguangcaii]|uniref:DUF2567 domain-containing protein n=1 Tax=Aeromicrobium duanguangcaii TaxID=2968086 RepID=A0ABY5KIS5_9ACTN|nr:hypothetical protein [Aeromicrobium duanguangcaii]MCD9153238.1 hypothetical protein [Aeromicrobium duanguangcaii]MCL3836769.1 hypothetical protein [Aeromicrobium duanguangcaii]UUI69663.1 hypothetical protein NP095_06100 [Aeromicrobium duanguangcaii]
MNRVSGSLLAVVASGIPAGFVWWGLGRPAQWLATERGLVLTEENATGRFQVVAVFTVVGVVLGLVAGVAVQRFTRSAQWQTVVGLAAAASAASLLCWRLGVWLGPSSPRDATGLEVGDVVRDQFAVDTIVPFLLWPLAAVLSYTITLYLSSDGVEDDEPDDEVSERSAP